MRKLLTATILWIFGIGIGLGAAYGFNKIWQPVSVSAAAPAPVNVQAGVPQQAKTPVPSSSPLQPQNTAAPNQNWNNGSWHMGPGMMNSWQGNNTPNQQYRGMGPGMMGGCNNNSGQGNWGMGMMGGWNGAIQTGQRISIDQAIASAKQYAAGYGQGLTVAEIMEFNNNFYISVKETSTGRGAFELLVDPYSGAVYPEIGPNMMWNTRYGHMGNGQVVENRLTVDQAVQQGQTYLDANLAGAQLQSDGTSFYGYYTFDYKINDQVAGMLSVNGFDGSVWLHTWHGQFIAEQEVK